MASGFSAFYANKVLDKVLKSVDFTPTTSYWVALFTNAGAAAFLRANDIASATEVSGGSYARKEIRGATGIGFTTAAGGASENNADITFPTASGTWGTVYAIALMDASTAGNVVMYGDLPTPKAVSAPDVFRIPSTFLDILL